MPFDFKKEYREFYMPGNKPEIVRIPKAKESLNKSRCADAAANFSSDDTI